MCVAKRAPARMAARVVAAFASVWPTAATAPAAAIRSIACSASRKLRREGHETSPAIRKPAVESAKVDRTELVDRDRARSLRIEKRALEVEADAALVRQVDRGPRRQEIARDTAPDQGLRVVDVEVDEAREDVQFPFRLRRSLDRDDAIRLDPDDAGVRAVKGVDQEPGNRSHPGNCKVRPAFDRL